MMMGAADPLWRRVEAAIESVIEADGLRAGDRMPGEEGLAMRLGAHRHTIRRAIESLSSRGLLIARRGHGTFVAGAPIAYRIGPRSRFTDNMQAAGLAPGLRILRSTVSAADLGMARSLQIELGMAVICLTVLRTGNGVPLVLARHAIPADRFPGFADRFAALCSITRTFASYGVEGYTRRVTNIAARVPDAAEAADLGLPPSVPVLVWKSVNADQARRAINLDCSVFPGSRVSILVEAADPE